MSSAHKAFSLLALASSFAFMHHRTFMIWLQRSGKILAS